jgi:hypothetical protein
MVEFEQPTYDNFLGLSKDLERLFGRKVDILTARGLESIRVKSIADGIRPSPMSRRKDADLVEDISEAIARIERYTAATSSVST